MGKRKIDIARIDEQNKRMVTFSKRRKGLFSKAEKFSKEFGVEASLIVFSPAGKPFTFGPVDAVVDRILGSRYERTNDQLMGQRVQAKEEQMMRWQSEFTTIVKEERTDLEKLKYMDSRLEKLRENILAWVKDASFSSSCSLSNSLIGDNAVIDSLDDGDDWRVEGDGTSISTVMDFSVSAMNGESKEDDVPLVLPSVDIDYNFDGSEFFNDDTEEQNHDVTNDNALPVFFSSDLDLDFDFGVDSGFDFDSFDCY